MGCPGAPLKMRGNEGHVVKGSTEVLGEIA